MEWSRRRTVRACGLGALAALTASAGCLGGEGTPLRVERVWLPEGGDDAGNLAVRARVANPSGSRASANLYLYAGVGGDTLVRRRSVTVDAGATTDVTASFDVSYETALAQGVSARADLHRD
ncbi:hypothetical protein [Halarchaeum sp. P4]|uniref:hypothetical protein n=1 Tax=Halarchaeum sp. P4 TaxID=3421639 RepID=UPI003EC019A4